MKISGSIGKIWLGLISIGKIWPRWYELGQNFDNYKVSQNPTGNYFLSVLSTKIKLAIDLDEVDIFDVIGKIWLRPRSIGKIWPRWYELRQNFDNYKVSQKPTGNYFLSVLSTKIKLAIELDEVENFG